MLLIFEHCLTYDFTGPVLEQNNLQILQEESIQGQRIDVRFLLELENKEAIENGQCNTQASAAVR